jgi:flavin reductase (DIM6/NTAB) family NADH-FMN oxidoreductase RutF
MNPEQYHYYEPATGHGLKHNPFNALIAPRPIGWISSVSGSGKLNLAPYSFFNAFLYDPPVIGFSSISRKDTVRNAEQTGEFVWNLVTMELREKMNATATPAPEDVSEFDLAQLTELEQLAMVFPVSTRIGLSQIKGLGWAKG